MSDNRILEQAAIFNELAEFMSKRHDHYDNHPELDKDVDKLGKLLKRIIEQRYDSDHKGWNYVDFMIINRKEHRSPFPFLAYMGDDHSLRTLRRGLETALINLAAAHDNVKNIESNIQHQERKEIGRASCRERV